MTLREIPGTGIRVSRLGLGTVKFGRNQGVKYPRTFDLPTDSEIHHLLDVAREGGIHFLDTAPAYGTSEERIGAILAERSDDWVISTKAGEEFSEGQSHFDFSPQGIRCSVERSQRRLRRERLEIVLLHSDGNDVDLLQHSGALETLHALKAAGSIGAIGISTKTVEGGLAAFRLGADIVMAAYNPWHRVEEPILDAAVAARRSIFIKKALGSGWLGQDATLSPKDQVRQAFDFIFAHPGTTAVVVGSSNPANLKLNCELASAAEANALP
ncbi:MAG: putative oxidoreductase [Verrucomicrobia bacterium]|jgi:aryl-alcohol dehydrogenase-like predicted oxidoreductase|nr:MAG: putative oxidoreductase [Verrucomicrobiota bacterium]